MALLADDLPSDLTDDERKYFETRGESGLTPPDAAPTPQPQSPQPAPPPPPPVQEPPPLQPQPAPPVEPPGDDDDEVEETTDQTGKTVRRIPLRKFKALEERYTTTNKELSTARARQQELEQILSRADERLKIINEALAQPEHGEPVAGEEEDPRPDPRVDVFAYMDWKERRDQRLYEQTLEQITGLSTRHSEVEERQQAERERQALVGAFRNDAMAYAQSNPQFGGAYTYLMNMRDAQYEALGLTDRAARRDRINAEEAAIVREAYAAGINPADRLYRLALVSGYNPNGNAAAPQPQPQPQPAPPSNVVPMPNVAAEIAAARSGQRAALSLSQGGGAPADQLTPEVLANMPQDQFNRIKERLERTNPARLRELLGG